MQENTIQARLVNKHDTEENWLKSSAFIPKQGEIIVYDIDDNYDYERFKIGDGERSIGDLPFCVPPELLNIEIPTKVSELENDNNYISSIPDEYPTRSEVQEIFKSVRVESPSGFIFRVSVTDNGALITEKEKDI